MAPNNEINNENRFGTAPVFFTAISTILGAILFLRFGFAVGTLGFFGVLFIIIIGHLVTFSTALALAEIATNQRVEGGGEYFIISRSFGLNIGGTIGIALFLSQSISVAFYVIAFTEAFSPLFEFVKNSYGFELPRQIISVPTMLILAYVIIKKGASIGVKILYIVVAILFLSLFLFFAGTTEYSVNTQSNLLADSFKNSDSFFYVFAIIFPAFTGMTAGVGLSGDLKNPRKSIPLGTLSATLAGFVVYILVIWKLSVSASPEDLLNDQLIMSKIAVLGFIVVPLGLAASTLSSAIGSILVAPRTLQAIGLDDTFPLQKINRFISKGLGKDNEPFNSTIITSGIALIFVALGDVNAVAAIISMFFMVTYGSLCLISFLHHFGSDPSYRPTFTSRWYFSLMGFILSFWLMFQMSTTYAFLSILLMIGFYLVIDKYHKDRTGLSAIFISAIFQLSRRVQVYLQKVKKAELNQNWRPSAVCISEDSFERIKAFELLNWISFRHGFGTYIHLINGYYSKAKNKEAKEILNTLINRSHKVKGNMYVDIIISPSYTSAIAQILQLPSPSGLENNMIIFEYDKYRPNNLEQIIDNIALAHAGDYDVCVLGCSSRSVNFDKGIHIWIRAQDSDNSNLMILLSYIILGHPSWKNGFIKIFNVCKPGQKEETKKELDQLVLTGRLPITEKNIQVIEVDDQFNFKNFVNEYSFDAGLVLIGFNEAQIKHYGVDYFNGYDKIGDILFVDAQGKKEIR